MDLYTGVRWLNGMKQLCLNSWPRWLSHPVLHVVVAVFAVLSVTAIGQEEPSAGQNSAQQRKTYQNMTPDQRAAATRAFLGLGPEPNKAAAARGAPLFQQNCAFCHGQNAHGVTAPSLITSDEVLSDDHGERLTPFLKAGRPDKGMPAFATMSDEQLNDIAEFLHLQVEDVANRGTYHVLNIVVGNPVQGETYVKARCMKCHTAETFAHIGSSFGSPDQLQRGWIWPASSENSKLAISATVKQPGGATLTGRVKVINDFRITVVDSAGQTHVINRGPGIEVEINDPLADHQEMIQTLTNNDMHNVTAYLATLK